MRISLKNIPFLLVDILSFYLALFLALLVRSGPSFRFEIFTFHFKPFLVVLVLWVLIFFIAGLYDIRNFSKRLFYLKLFIVSVIVGFAFSAGFFYASPSSGIETGIAPKTILALFVLFFGIIDYGLRELLHRFYLGTQPLLGVGVIGKGKDVLELVNYLRENPQLGYRVKLWIQEYRREEFDGLINNNHLDMAVIPGSLSQNKEFASKIYREMLSGVEVVSFSGFYENIFGKVSLDELEENWFLEKLAPKNDFYIFAKRILDIFLAFIILVITVIFWPLVAILIKLSSRGSVFFLGKRVGAKEKEFMPYKFRTMEDGGGETTAMKEEFGVVKNDERVFRLGKILRRLRIDEWPQVINVLRGELSFVGPRADFVDFYKFLKAKIPYYQIRTIITPGLTGWAQIHNTFGSSIEGTKERLAYDIYYIKNRSFALDLVVVLKTLRTIFTFSGV